MGIGSQIFGGYSKDEVDENIKKLKDEKKEILLELRAAQEKVIALERHLTETQKVMNGLQEEVEENKALFDKEEGKLTDFDRSNLLFDYRKLVMKAKNLANKDKNVNGKMAELEEENIHLRKQINDLVVNLEEKRGLEEFVEKLSNSLLEGNENENIEDLVHKLKDKVQSSLELEKQTKKQAQIIEKLERELEGTKASNKDVTDQYHSLSNELTGVLLKNKELINKVEELKVEVNSLESLKDKLTKNRENLTEELKNLNDKINQDQVIILELQERANVLLQSNQALEFEIAENKAYKVKIGDVFQKVVNISATIEEKVEEEAKRLIQKRVEEFFGNKSLYSGFDSSAEVAVANEEQLIIDETLALEDKEDRKKEDLGEEDPVEKIEEESAENTESAF